MCLGLTTPHGKYCQKNLSWNGLIHCWFYSWNDVLTISYTINDWEEYHQPYPLKSNIWFCSCFQVFLFLIISDRRATPPHYSLVPVTETSCVDDFALMVINVTHLGRKSGQVLDEPDLYSLLWRKENCPLSSTKLFQMMLLNWTKESLHSASLVFRSTNFYFHCQELLSLNKELLKLIHLCTSIL